MAEPAVPEAVERKIRPIRSARRKPLGSLSERTPIWVTGSMLAAALCMITGLITLLMVQGLGFFWPTPLWQVSLKDGTKYLALVHRTEVVPSKLDAAGRPARRTLFRVGNRDLYGNDFVWVEDVSLQSRSRPREAVVVERLEWGPFYGFVQEIKTPAVSFERDRGDRLGDRLKQQLPAARRRYKRIRHIEQKIIGDINYKIESRRLEIRKAERRDGADSPEARSRTEAHRKAITSLEEKYAGIAKELAVMRQEDQKYRVVLVSHEGRTKDLPISSIFRVYHPNQLSWFGRLGVYLDRLGEYLFSQPREANSEGGVAPAIFGTVMMTLIMSMAVVPLGVLAAVYLHEYAKQGLVVSTVRIAVNNLAGVPSIVFGVFGLGFFCYFVGGTIDQLFFPERLPTPTYGGGGILWAALTLALMTVPVVIVATEEALAAVPDGVRAASLACGATKFQTVCRVVLPSAIPGILTGTILAMARGAGEVAPLMITGVVKLAPSLPVDHVWPFIHLERKFMHLGFHIYDVGFQSPNIEASKPMVYMTALLLLGIVLCLNLAAMHFRGRLRERFRGAEV